MVSESSSPRRPDLPLADAATLPRRAERLQALTAAELTVAFSQAFDLAEGKPAGHAQRVCYIACALAEELSLDAPARAGIFFAALLHDAGVTRAASELCRVAGVDESAIFGPSPLAREERRADLVFADPSAVTDALRAHTALGVETLADLELPEEAAVAIRHHHERWDGQGFPDALCGEEIPIGGRVVAAADIAEALIAEEQSALIARRHFASSIAPYAGQQLDPAVGEALLRITREDPLWLGLYADDLGETLAAMRAAGDARRSRRRVERFAEVVAGLADAKGAHTPGHARRTSESAARLASAAGLDSGHVELVRLAALLHDIGLFGVPARVMSKPDILTVTEMQLMREHPAHAEAILESLTGFEEIARWVGRHHERPDGKGYPELLSGDDIPLESRIMAVADMYAALTSARPHRGAMPPAEAKKIMLGAAGTQLDAELARTFIALV